MPLATIIQEMPADVKKALQDGLPSFRSFNSADAIMRQTLLQETHGQTVFTLGVPDVLSGGKGLSGAKSSGWRVAVSNGGAAIAADIYTMERGGKYPLPVGAPRLACIRQGPEVDNMLQTITSITAPSLAGQLPAEPFNVQLLIMPGLFTDALLLQPQNSGSTASFIIPFHTLVGNVHLNYAYTEQELIALLRPIAEKWISCAPKLSRAAYSKP
jgi:hypothetical protein